MDNNESSESENLIEDRFRLTGIHRGMTEPPKMKTVQEASWEYFASYSKYKEAEGARGQLYYMISMGFPENVIRMMSEISLRVWDLDFFRILYFITNDFEYVKKVTARSGEYVFEDILDDALEVAIENKHPEYKEIKEKDEQLKQLKALADLRIKFMEENNQNLSREIETRREEKILNTKASGMELEELKKEKAEILKESERLNQIIGELKGSLSEKETDIQRLNEELEKVCSERDENKATNDTFANGIQNILDALHTAKTEIKGSIESVGHDVPPAKKQDSKSDEATHTSDSNDEDVKRIFEAFNSLEKKIEQMSNSMSYETAEGAMIPMVDRMEFLAEKTMKSVFAVDQNVIDMINNMQINLLENLGKKKRFGRLLESVFQKTDTEKPAELIRLEPIRYMPEPPNRNEELVKRILSDPQLTPEHYKLILYCVDQGLPYRYLQQITNQKMDPDRLEELVIFYFKLNKMNYQYRRKGEDTCDIESGQTPDNKKEPVDSESKANNVENQDLKRGQKHKSQATSMVFAAASDEEDKA